MPEAEREESLPQRESRLAATLRGATSEGPEQAGHAMARLLVTRLRFQRLLRGSARAKRWYERDPEAFTRAFRAYCTAVPSRSPDGQVEAHDFGTWIDGEPTHAETPSNSGEGPA